MFGYASVHTYKSIDVYKIWHHKSMINKNKISVQIKFGFY